MAKVFRMHDRPNSSTFAVPDTPIMVNGVPYTRGEIARGTGLSLSHVSRIFSGKRMPSMNTAKRLTAFFGCKMDQLARLLESVGSQGEDTHRRTPPQPIYGQSGFAA